MKAVNIPEGYQQVMPYLVVPGAAKFFDFMQKVFDSEEVYKAMRDEHTVQHAELTIGNHKVMFCDSTDVYPPQTAGMFVYVDDCDTIFKKAIDAGATQVMPPADMDYGRAAGVKDPVGNIWWITSV
ncbi:VOC family protein [Mucilaginibacter agri]|uniref:VOC family protein n=1 Tax=Mucilaginibacter agri TaxID=2695265 RepID=A0A965ZFL9_9SPHI|nr:VOC family protein [Mucilaginibacter agri]NCD68781.1 VOC family protein [Mucilaginibacter agri]